MVKIRKYFNCSSYIYIYIYYSNLYRERQQQIEELTKQLKRTHEEYELLRQKLLQYQNKKGVKIIFDFFYFDSFLNDLFLILYRHLIVEIVRR